MLQDPVHEEQDWRGRAAMAVSNTRRERAQLNTEDAITALSAFVQGANVLQQQEKNPVLPQPPSQNPLLGPGHPSSGAQSTCRLDRLIFSIFTSTAATALFVY